MTDKKLTAKSVEKALREKRNPEKAEFFPKFFKAGKGEYAEGDKFIGVIVPDQRKIAAGFKTLPIVEIHRLLDSPFHECRLTGVLILVSQFEKAKSESDRKRIYEFYLKNADQINNWDLVDSSAHKIVGPFLLEKSHKPLFKLAKAKHLWKNRIAIIATFHFIKNDRLETTIELAEVLLHHEHDLIHKAVGWMLRELGKRNEQMLFLFLDLHAHEMPRTMLRYAIEKLTDKQRKSYLAKKGD